MPDEPRRRWYDPLGGDVEFPPQRRGTAIPPVSDAVRAFATRRGWRAHLAAGDLHAAWSAIVGDKLAEHTSPLRLQGGVLVLTASSPLWASEVRQLGSAITRRVNDRLGEGTVRTITVSVRRTRTP
jgi:predicted nucleic acid-binding Zn ribbon protein